MLNKIYYILDIYFGLSNLCNFNKEIVSGYASRIPPLFELTQGTRWPCAQPFDAQSRKLLEIISIEATLHQRHFTVNELLGMKDIGSQASIHKKVHSLVEGGYISLETQEDARVKKALPSKKAKQFFSQINKLFISVAKSAG